MKIKLIDNGTLAEMDNKIEFMKAMRRLTNIPLKRSLSISRFESAGSDLTHDVVSKVVGTSRFKEDIDILQENGYDVEIIGCAYVEEINMILQTALDEGDSGEAAILANTLSQLIQIKNDK